MELSREQAINEHRKMWSWIAENVEKLKPKCIEEIKCEYLQIHDLDFKDVYHLCFLCEYARHEMKKYISVSDLKVICEFCPIEWDSDRCYRSNTLFNNTIYNKIDNSIALKIYSKASYYARLIAELPEKENKNEL